ncbi:MAG: helix-turn-helix transcriptional regulator [Sphingomonadales bacterium]|nr:helix-turn-helix transcriptional regulator [Sphingomonadales bacterium]MDE2567829.1 helix-turn-helix transcriptional regulator [Sphingomonadales bacterium]
MAADLAGGTSAEFARARPDARRRRLDRQVLTSPALIALDYYPPPPDLEPFVTTYFLMRCDERTIADIQPAGVGILGAFMRGRGEMFIPDGRIDSSHTMNLLTPLAAAAPILVDGPWHSFGAALSPLGWGAMTGLSASEYGNRLREAGELLGPDFTALGETMARRYGQPGFEPEHMALMFSEAIRRVLKPLPDLHVRLMGEVAAWLGESLSPTIDDLTKRALYSPRQLQRLVDRYFGLPPKQLARKYRALRAASLLASPATSAEDVAAIEGAFYDQSHMIREIRLFVGRTPARLGDQGAPLLSELIDMRNFREISPRIAPMPKGLGE